MFARLYHPLILRGACARTCRCTCRCLTTGERLSYLDILVRTRQMSSTNGSQSPSSPVNTSKSDGTQSLKAPAHNRSACIFCRIVDGNEPQSKDKIIFQDEEFVVFPDIRPAAKHHLLVVTKEHIRDAKCLTSSHGELVQRMVDTGKKALSERIKSESSTMAQEVQEETVSKALLGFHWPPFHTISHLHLHVIAPANEVGFVGRLMFRPNSFWFVQPSWVQERLNRTAKVQDSASS